MRKSLSICLLLCTGLCLMPGGPAAAQTNNLIAPVFGIVPSVFPAGQEVAAVITLFNGNSSSNAVVCPRVDS